MHLFNHRILEVVCLFLTFSWFIQCACVIMILEKTRRAEKSNSELSLCLFYVYLTVSVSQE